MEKTVLITGASRGIGAALAKTFAAEGYNLSLCCHNNTRLLNDHALSLHEQYGIQPCVGVAQMTAYDNTCWPKWAE